MPTFIVTHRQPSLAHDRTWYELHSDWPHRRVPHIPVIYSVKHKCHNKPHIGAKESAKFVARRARKLAGWLQIEPNIAESLNILTKLVQQ